MRIKKILLIILPFIGVLIDYTIGYPALSWVTESLPVTIISESAIVLIASVAIVMLELLFGASGNKNLKMAGLLVVLCIPAFTIAEGFNRYTESVMLELPPSDIARIVITQVALVFLSASVHFMILTMAPLILALFSGEDVDELLSEYNRESEVDQSNDESQSEIEENFELSEEEEIDFEEALKDT